jgi:hypothetical protein
MGVCFGVTALILVRKCLGGRLLELGVPLCVALKLDNHVVRCRPST